MDFYCSNLIAIDDSEIWSQFESMGQLADQGIRPWCNSIYGDQDQELLVPYSGVGGQPNQQFEFQPEIKESSHPPEYQPALPQNHPIPDDLPQRDILLEQIQQSDHIQFANLSMEFDPKESGRQSKRAKTHNQEPPLSRAGLIQRTKELDQGNALLQSRLDSFMSPASVFQEQAPLQECSTLHNPRRDAPKESARPDCPQPNVSRDFPILNTLPQNMTREVNLHDLTQIGKFGKESMKPDSEMGPRVSSGLHFNAESHGHNENRKPWGLNISSNPHAIPGQIRKTKAHKEQKESIQELKEQNAVPQSFQKQAMYIAGVRNVLPPFNSTSFRIQEIVYPHNPELATRPRYEDFNTTFKDNTWNNASNQEISPQIGCTQIVLQNHLILSGVPRELPTQGHLQCKILEENTQPEIIEEISDYRTGCQHTLSQECPIPNGPSQNDVLEESLPQTRPYPDISLQQKQSDRIEYQLGTRNPPRNFTTDSARRYTPIAFVSNLHDLTQIGNFSREFRGTSPHSFKGCFDAKLYAHNWNRQAWELNGHEQFTVLCGVEFDPFDHLAPKTIVLPEGKKEISSLSVSLFAKRLSSEQSLGHVGLYHGPQILMKTVPLQEIEIQKRQRLKYNNLYFTRMTKPNESIQIALELSAEIEGAPGKSHVLARLVSQKLQVVSNGCFHIAGKNRKKSLFSNCDLITVLNYTKRVPLLFNIESSCLNVSAEGMEGTRKDGNLYYQRRYPIEVAVDLPPDKDTTTFSISISIESSDIDKKEVKLRGNHGEYTSTATVPARGSTRFYFKGMHCTRSCRRFFSENVEKFQFVVNVVANQTEQRNWSAHLRSDFFVVVSDGDQKYV